MTILKMKNYNMILTQKLQKYNHYQKVKLVNTSFLQAGKEIFQSDQIRIIEQAQFTYSPFGKVFEKKKKKQLKIRK